MITFWSIAACCIALGLACVLAALLRGGSPAPVSRRAAAAAVYRDQLLEVDLDVAPELQPRLRGGDTLFIVARAAAGPQMPLAVLKRSAKGFPYAFELDDTLAMSPDRPLSLAGPVLVSARISRSGSATPRAGDLLAAAMPSEVGGAAVKVLIDRQQQ